MEELYDSAKLASQAEKVLEAANAFQQGAQTKLDTVLSMLSDAWSGEEAEAFFKKANIISDEIKTIAGEICASCEAVNEEICGR